MKWEVSRARVALAFGLVALAACAKTEKEKLPVITTGGPHAVVAGQTITVTATTTNGTDEAYTFVASDPAVATVDELGVVTGVAPGEAKVTVTGATTGAVADHAVVVVATDDTSQIPYYDKWMMSAHADATSEPFNHWNADGEVPTTCARCHSSEGFVDYLGGDGSTPGVVDKAAPIQSVIRCQTCHNAAADALASVTFPSGVTIDGLGGEARCMTCHQGRSSGADVDKAIMTAATTSDDEISTTLNFQNIHYYPAAATLFAGRAKGGYQYPGQVYDVRFRHVDGFNTCIGCHDPHSTKVRFDQCSACHTGVSDVESAHQIRMMSSQGRDYDGDGDTTEGVYGEMIGLRDKLRVAIATAGSEQNTPICYSPDAYPYFFAAAGTNGACDPADAVASNGFKSWTPRMLRAAYNYQMATKDPGAFAHNAKYIIELLTDSINDLNTNLVVKVDMSKAVRTDYGHFNGASEAARHWDSGEQVDSTCSSCHGGQEGYRFYVQYGVGKVVPETANGLECGTCHDNFGDTFDVATVPSVTFPSGVTRKEDGYDNLCENCHRGRESKATVDAQIATGKFKFMNIHYLAAGATKLGSAAHVGYEYTGKTYAGPLAHTGGAQCTSCHDPVTTKHSFRIEDAWDGHCKTCHADADGDATKIRVAHTADYDGDGNVTESLPAEIDGLAAKVLAAMQAVAAAPGLCYSPSSYPYFFKDTDGNKTCSATEMVSSNGFAGWTAPLMKASFNYQMSRKDPGAWAHNFNYMAQLLYDSVEDLGGSVAGMTRP